MSKSLGNVVDPLALLSKEEDDEGFPVDVLRYYLLKEGAIGADMEFSIERVAMCERSELCNTLGNLCTWNTPTQHTAHRLMLASRLLAFGTGTRSTSSTMLPSAMLPRLGAEHADMTEDVDVHFVVQMQSCVHDAAVAFDTLNVWPCHKHTNSSAANCAHATHGVCAAVCNCVCVCYMVALRSLRKAWSG